MLEIIAVILFFGFGVAALSHFIDFCMEPGNILSPYYQWLMRFAKVQYNEKTGEITSQRWYFKPLGGCIRCLNFWIGLFVFMPVAHHMGWIVSMWIPLFLIYSGYSFIFLVHLQTKLKHG